MNIWKANNFRQLFYDNSGLKVSVIFGFLALYAVIITVTSFHHELFIDETQAWQIAKSNDVAEIFNLMPYEGTPVLWHLMLKGISVLGFTAAKILNLIFALVTAYVFLFYAPFNKYIKLLIIFSFFFLYEYPVVTRHYQLSVMLIFMLAAFFHLRKSKPILYGLLLFLTSQIIIFSTILVVGLWVFLFFEFLYKHISPRQFSILSVFVIAAMIVVFLQVKPAESADDSVLIRIIGLGNSLRTFSNALLPSVGHFIYPGFFFIPFFGLLTIPLLRKPAVFISLAITVALASFIYMFVYGGAARHHSYLMIYVLFFFWIYRNTFFRESGIAHDKIRPIFNSIQNIAVKGWKIQILFFAIAILVAFRSIYLEIRDPFSTSKAAAKYVDENIAKDDHLLISHEFMASAILTYSATRDSVWMFWKKDFSSYGNLKYKETIFEDVDKKNVHGVFDDNKTVYLINTSKPEEARLPQDKYKFICEFRSNSEIRFWKAKVGPEVLELYKLVD